VPQPDPETRLILNHDTNRYVRIGLREYEWLGRLNGQVHVRELPAFLDRDPAFVKELLDRMHAAKLICFSNEAVKLVALEQPVTPAAIKRFEWTQFGQMRIHLGQARALLERISRLRVLSNRLFLVFSLGVSIGGLALGMQILQLADLTKRLQNYPWHWWQIVSMVALVFFTTVVHEMGHGVACTYFGAPVRSIGIMLYYLQPAAYVDITDAWVLKNKWHRVAISFAGIYVQLIINNLAVMLWFVLRAAGHQDSDWLVIFISLNLSMVLFNLLPFIRLDGYWMLSNIVDIPNLRDRAMEWCRVCAVSLITRRPIDARRLCYNAVLTMPPLSRSLLVCFGLTSVVFSASMWLGGLSFLLRITRWLHMPGITGALAALGLLLVGGAAYVIRSVIARRRERRQANRASIASEEAQIPPVGSMVVHAIDRTRPIRLNSYATVLDHGNGTLTFAWSTVDQLTIKAPAQLLDLVPALRNGITLQDLEKSQAHDSSVEQLIQRLWHLKHVRYESAWAVAEENLRYSRQLGWFSMNAATRGSEVETLSRLRHAAVTILGVGGMGSHVAWNLAACGVGELHLVDGDIVELSNLNRQLFYTPADIGRPKVEVAAERLAEYNSNLKTRVTRLFLRGVDDISEVIHGADFVVRSLDTPMEAQAWVSEACVGMSIPCIGGGFMAQGAVVGPTVIPGETACLACHVPATIPRVDRGIGATLAPVVALSAGLMAGEVITYIGKLGPLRTAGKLLFIEAPTFNFHFTDVPRDENCRVCGKLTRAVREKLGQPMSALRQEVAIG
jgi:molybdopterin/thiamine biosynthesis adenylyltransferase/Zn-dependent protease